MATYPNMIWMLCLTLSRPSQGYSTNQHADMLGCTFNVFYCFHFQCSHVDPARPLRPPPLHPLHLHPRDHLEVRTAVAVDREAEAETAGRSLIVLVNPQSQYHADLDRAVHPAVTEGINLI